jgi:ribosomal protein S18 acetylase RimI-like enzyme
VEADREGRASESETEVSALEARIQAAILSAAARGRNVERIGPFTATFNATSTNPFLSYAIPEAAATPSPDDIEALVAAYRLRSRVPRLEYLPTLAPAVEPALVAAGFTVDARAPLMTFSPGCTPAAPAGIELVETISDENIRAAAMAQHEAYDEPEPPTDSWIAGVHASIDAGGVLVLARNAQTGEPAGGGQCTPPHEGATELTSIGVRLAYRRQGIAAGMTALLAETMRARGADLVFLMAAGEPEARIYARVGFERVGEVLYVSRPDQPKAGG